MGTGEFRLGPWKPTIRAYPRAAIEGLDPDEDFLWISITDPGKGFVGRPAVARNSFENASKCKARLCLSFWDAEDVNQMPGGFWSMDNPPPTLPLNEADLFQPWQAERVIKWLIDHWGETYLLVLNCEGGLSRSPSMAVSLAYLLGDADSTWGSKTPNARIPTLLLAAGKEAGL